MLGHVVDAAGNRWSARDNADDAAQAAALVAEELQCAERAATSCAHRRPYVLATLAEAQRRAGRVDEAAATARCT
ncbi:MAG: hypothetical protein AB7O97_21395 [Planctomycetota bacterium]